MFSPNRGAKNDDDDNDDAFALLAAAKKRTAGMSIEQDTASARPPPLDTQVGEEEEDEKDNNAPPESATQEVVVASTTTLSSSSSHHHRRRSSLVFPPTTNHHHRRRSSVTSAQGGRGSSSDWNASESLFLMFMQEAQELSEQNGMDRRLSLFGGSAGGGADATFLEEDDVAYGASSTSSPTATANTYTVEQHAQHLRLRTEASTASYWQYCDMTHLFAETTLPGMVKDYLSPIPLPALQDLYHGMQPLQQTTGDKDKESCVLPVRTVALWIRPDVLSGMVMDAVVQQAVHRQHMEIVKRQGCHFQAQGGNFFLDAQLCVHTRCLERRLILRIYHAPLEKYNMGITESVVQQEATNADIPLNRHLKQACALVQQKRRPSPKKNAAEMNQVLWHQQEQIHHPSVLSSGQQQQGNGKLYPSWNPQDWQLIQSSWTLLVRIWTELVQRQCAVSTLPGTPLGHAETANEKILDVHYQATLEQLAYQQVQQEVVDQTNALQEMDSQYQQSASNSLSILAEAFCRYELEMPILSTAVVQPVVHEEEKESKSEETEEQTTAKDEEEEIDLVEKDLQDFAAKSGQATMDPVEFADQVVSQIYQRYMEQADRQQRLEWKQKHIQLAETRSQLQRQQEALVQSLYKQESTAALQASHEFTKLAQKASNAKGKLLRYLSSKQLPLLECPLEKNGGVIMVTRSLLLISTLGRFVGQTTKIWEVRQVRLQASDVVVGRSPSASDESTVIVLDRSTDSQVAKIRIQSQFGMTAQRLCQFVDSLTELEESNPTDMSPKHKFVLEDDD